MGIPYRRGSEPGLPVVDADACSTCGDCVEACPVGVLKLEDGRVLVERDAVFGCIACAHCTMVCPTDAMTVSGRGMEGARLVDLPPAGQRAGAEALRALLLARRSVRRFGPDEVPRETLDRVIAAAALAPMGIPPWDVGVVAFHGRDKVARLARDVADAYRGLLRFVDNPLARGLLWLLAPRKTHRQMVDFILPLGRDIVRAAREGRDKVLYDAPAALLFHASAWSDTADAAIACTYAMLAAEAEGLGTTMIGCAAPPLARRRALLDAYGLPAGNQPKIVLIMGHPNVRYCRAIERPFDTVTYH
jgi:ferredoxin/nitroreductase